MTLEVRQTMDPVMLRGSRATGRSVMEILRSSPERRLFQTAEEVNAHLAVEKTSWVRSLTTNL